MLSGPIRSAAVLGLAWLLAFAVAGCVQLEQKVLLNGDGSLAVTYHFSVAEDSEPVIAAGAQVIQEWQGRPTGSAAWFTSEEAVRQHFAATGVQVQKYRSYSAGGRRHIEVLLFAEYGPAALNSGFLGPLRCDRLANGNVRLWADLPAVPRNAAGLDEQAIAALAQDLYLRLEFSVPGEVISTTAGKHDRNSAVWTFDPAKDPSFLRAPPRLECAFAASRLEWVSRLPAAPEP